MSEFNALSRTNESISNILKALVKDLGLQLVNLILGAKRGQIKKWISGEEIPSESQKRLIYSLGDVSSILLTYLEPKPARLWIVSHSDFLFGIPAKEVRSRPEDVRMAALNRVARGEDFDVL